MNAVVRQRQSRFPVILDFLKKRPGVFLHDNEIKASTSCGNNALASFRVIAARDLPQNIQIQKSGKNHLYKWIESPDSTPAGDRKVGLLMTLSFGQRETVTGTLDDFRSLYEQLKPLFGGDK